MAPKSREKGAGSRTAFHDSTSGTLDFPPPLSCFRVPTLSCAIREDFASVETRESGGAAESHRADPRERRRPARTGTHGKRWPTGSRRILTAFAAFPL
jgi:hypothetical protein